MRIPFAPARFCEEAMEEAMEGLRMTLRRQLPVAQRRNPFARPLPCPISGERPSAQIIRAF